MTAGRWMGSYWIPIPTVPLVFTGNKKKKGIFIFIAVHVSFHRHFWTWKCLFVWIIQQQAIRLMFIRQLFARSIWKKEKMARSFFSFFFFPLLVCVVLNWVQCVGTAKQFPVSIFPPLLIYRFLSGCLLFKRYFPLPLVAPTNRKTICNPINIYKFLSHLEPSSSSTTTTTYCGIHIHIMPHDQLAIQYPLFFSLVTFIYRALTFVGNVGIYKRVRISTRFSFCSRLIVPVGYAAVDGGDES